MDRFYSYSKKFNLFWVKFFVNNYEFYGGDIKGVIDKLLYLKDLGIFGIYFILIFEFCIVYKYDIKDYFKIDL